METKTLPISKLSYSALVQLLRNPLIFKLRYVLGVFTPKMGVSGMVGKAAHEALKAYYGSNPDVPLDPTVPGAQEKAKQVGLEYLATYDDAFIDFGKTGNRESLLKAYTQAMDFYFAEEPEYHEIVCCEEKLEAELKTVDGQELPLPAVGIPDVVHRRKDGRVEIVDTKFTASFTDYETEDWSKIIQAQFMWHLVRAAKGIEADRMVFREIKRTANKDGGAQVRDWVVPFDHEPYRIVFYNLYRDAVRYLSSDPIFLPNLSDPFDGEQAGLIYAQGLISADMSDVEVMHKVRDVAFTSKKFVPSQLESEVNKHLLPDEKVKLKLAEFGIPVEPVGTIVGASVTQYQFKVSAGVRMSTVAKHVPDIQKALAAKGDVRILAPIPGTSLIGVEVESADRRRVELSELDLVKGTLSIPIGAAVDGSTVKVSLADMPHLLVGGTTGSGKSTFIHSTLKALTEQLTPEELELVLVDPKRVELSSWEDSKHLRREIVMEHDEALRTLLELTDEMERRYKTLKRAGKREIGAYNASKRASRGRLPYIVMVIDELADLMLRAKVEKNSGKSSYGSHSKVWLAKEIKSRAGSGGLQIPETKAEMIELLERIDDQDEANRPDADVEMLVVRLAQMARAVGIHLILATQRPSVDVVTGLIKANFPTRIAFTTASSTDSQIILDQPGAERLSGKGDMLVKGPSVKGLLRLQGFVS